MGIMRSRFLVIVGSIVVLQVSLLSGVVVAFAEPWKFGVMGDSQWTTGDTANTNPFISYKFRLSIRLIRNSSKQG